MTTPNHMKWKGLVRSSFDTAMWYYPKSNVSFFIGVLGQNQCSMDGIDVIPGTECRFVTHIEGVGDLYEGDIVKGEADTYGGDSIPFEAVISSAPVTTLNQRYGGYVALTKEGQYIPLCYVDEITGNIHDPNPE